MKNFLVVAVIVLTSLSMTAQEKVNWITFEQAIEKNKANPKPILIDLYTDWCGWCKRMDANTYANPTIAKFINDNYYAVKMDGEGKEDITFQGKTFKFVQQGRSKYHELAAAIMGGKMSYPTTAFLDKEAKLLQSIPGYQDKKKFEVILNFFSNDNYKNTPWTDFEKNFKNTI